MKKTLFLIIASLFLCNSAFGQVPNIFANNTVADAILVNENFDYFETKFSTTGGHEHDGSDSKALTVLNSLVSVGTVTTGTWQATIVDEAYGGTGLNSYTTGDLIQATADTVLGKLSPGAAGTFVQSQGANTALTYSKVDLAATSDITGTLAVGNGGTGNTTGTPSGTAGGSLAGTYPNPTIASNAIPAVIFSWSGNDNYLADVAGTYIGVDATPAINSVAGEGYLFQAVYGDTYRTILNFRFKKVAEIDDVTIEARLWSDTANADDEAILNVDINGQSSTVKSVTSTTPTWVTASDIDVSGLTDGTIYDGVIQLKCEKATENVYCSAITLIGK